MVRWFFWVLFLASEAMSTKLLVIYEPSEPDILRLFESFSGGVSVAAFPMDRMGDEDNNASFCQTISLQSPLSALVDLSWGGGWAVARQISTLMDLPYLHVEVSNRPFVRGVDDLLYARDALDAALLFETESELDQGLFQVIGHFHTRVMLLSMQQGGDDNFRRMADLRPVPGAFVVFGTAQENIDILKRVLRQNGTDPRKESRWNYVIEDFDSPALVAAVGGLESNATIISMTESTCCGLNDINNATMTPCICKSKPKQLILSKAARLVSSAAAQQPRSYSCGGGSIAGNVSRASFAASIRSKLAVNNSRYSLVDNSLSFPIELEVKVSNRANKTLDLMGTWTEMQGVKFSDSFRNVPLQRFLRVGMSVALPWFFLKKDANEKEMRDENGNLVYQGYCLDLMRKIAEKLNLQFEVVQTKETRPGYTYGKRLDDGSWSGMIGDLTKGETDLIVADLTMTSEREEAIDFVSPYFDQAGISIVLRKRLRQQSLFKFLSVLKQEVWLGIVAAVVATALLLWMLDKHSPYSARNNPAAYAQPCRDFTLKESFWFALTSLTPQGGGEAPKALSGRVLVAAYWLFVVLMLATFTANLAAFLTVERMQTTVQSLEELARQSKINYTVIGNTSFMEYFVNMAGAEEELYHKWKELTLGSSTGSGGNPAKYRVWDYPIREQYTHLLKVIKETGPAKSTAEGFQRVLEHTEGDFAFIHDAARIRYEVYHNCNLTEVGEPFAEQPYALAVQQGSHLQEELSRVILELQKERFFETLQSTYWNSSARGNCPVMDDSEGITLQSLGGVFIATLIGLGLALLTLAVEVILQKRKDKRMVGNAGQQQQQQQQKNELPPVVVN